MYAKAALRLIDVAETHGVRGGVAINAIVNDRSFAMALRASGANRTTSGCGARGSAVR